MPKPPATISIVPSRLSLLVHAGIMVLPVGLSVQYAPWWFVVTATLSMLASGYWLLRQRSAWQLRWSPEALGDDEWQFRDAETMPWRRVQVHCHYLGAGLLGLRIDGRTAWIWPDSADADVLRQLRRYWVMQSHQ